MIFIIKNQQQMGYIKLYYFSPFQHHQHSTQHKMEWYLLISMFLYLVFLCVYV